MCVEPCGECVGCASASRRVGLRVWRRLRIARSCSPPRDVEAGGVKARGYRQGGGKESSSKVTSVAAGGGREARGGKMSKGARGSLASLNPIHVASLNPIHLVSLNKGSYVAENHWRGTKGKGGGREGAAHGSRADLRVSESTGLEAAQSLAQSGSPAACLRAPPAPRRRHRRPWAEPRSGRCRRRHHPWVGPPPGRSLWPGTAAVVRAAAAAEEPRPRQRSPRWSPCARALAEGSRRRRCCGDGRLGCHPGLVCPGGCSRPWCRRSCSH
eukprot:360433-Chlamydomonas_euryale.AAC.2